MYLRMSMCTFVTTYFIIHSLLANEDAFSGAVGSACALPCEHVCNTSSADHTCQCYQGFRLHQDGVSCEGEDSCWLGVSFIWAFLRLGRKRPGDRRVKGDYLGGHRNTCYCIIYKINIAKVTFIQYTYYVLLYNSNFSNSNFL